MTTKEEGETPKEGHILNSSGEEMCCICRHAHKSMHNKQFGDMIYKVCNGKRCNKEKPECAMCGVEVDPSKQYKTCYTHPEYCTIFCMNCINDLLKRQDMAFTCSNPKCAKPIKLFSGKQNPELYCCPKVFYCRLICKALHWQAHKKKCKNFSGTMVESKPSVGGRAQTMTETQQNLVLKLKGRRDTPKELTYKDRELQAKQDLKEYNSYPIHDRLKETMEQEEREYAAMAHIQTLLYGSRAKQKSMGEKPLMMLKKPRYGKRWTGDAYDVTMEKMATLVYWHKDTKGAVEAASTFIGPPLRAITQGEKYGGIIEWDLKYSNAMGNVESFFMRVDENGINSILKINTEMVKEELLERIFKLPEQTRSILAPFVRIYVDRLVFQGSSLDSVLFILKEFCKFLRSKTASAYKLKKLMMKRANFVKLNITETLYWLNSHMFVSGQTLAIGSVKRNPKETPSSGGAKKKVNVKSSTWTDEMHKKPKTGLKLIRPNNKLNKHTIEIMQALKLMNPTPSTGYVETFKPPVETGFYDLNDEQKAHNSNLFSQKTLITVNQAQVDELLNYCKETKPGAPIKIEPKRLIHVPRDLSVIISRLFLPEQWGRLTAYLIQFEEPTINQFMMNPLDIDPMEVADVKRFHQYNYGVPYLITDFVAQISLLLMRWDHWLRVEPYRTTEWLKIAFTQLMIMKCQLIIEETKLNCLYKEMLDPDVVNAVFNEVYAKFPVTTDVWMIVNLDQLQIMLSRLYPVYSSCIKILDQTIEEGFDKNWLQIILRSMLLELADNEYNSVAEKYESLTGVVFKRERYPEKTISLLSSIKEYIVKMKKQVTDLKTNLSVPK